MANPNIPKNDCPRTENIEDDNLFAQCREFLSVSVPSSNIIFDVDWQKFMPLFNQQLNTQISQEELDKISREYFSRFSTQHPIKIISREEDPNGIYNPATRKKHRVVTTIPAMHQRIQTLNRLGMKIPTLINALLNASIAHKNNPLSDNQLKYTRSIIEALSMANPKDKIEEKRVEFAAGEKNLLNGHGDSEQNKNGNTPSEDDECTTGLIDWG